MPLNLANATPVTPALAPVQSPSAAIASSGAQPVTPDQVKVTPLPSITAAGVDLAKYVLKILAIAIPVWVAILFVADLATTYTVHEAYRVAIEAVRNTESNASAAMRRKESMQKALSSMEKISHIASESSKGKVGEVPSEELKNTIAAIRDVQGTPGEPAQNVQKLKAILAVLESIQSAPAEIGKIEPKLKESVESFRAVIDTVAPSSAANAERLRSYVELLKELAAERKSVRDSWIQIGQMVLLNLLLPILTALLGYIFGTGSTRQSG